MFSAFAVVVAVVAAALELAGAWAAVELAWLADCGCCAAAEPASWSAPSPWELFEVEACDAAGG